MCYMTSLIFFNRSPEAGHITKKLKVAKAPDGRSYFFTLAINEKSKSPSLTQYSIPVSMGEFEVLKSLIDYCIPRFLAFDKSWLE